MIVMLIKMVLVGNSENDNKGDDMTMSKVMLMILMLSDIMEIMINMRKR